MTHEAAVGHGEYYTIPFRSLVPVKIENLMFAGRLVCAYRFAFASIRGMSQCMAIGQATGVAAVMALKGAARVQKVDSVALTGNLARHGVAGIADQKLAEILE